jgi:hypothetical protein
MLHAIIMMMDCTMPCKPSIALKVDFRLHEPIMAENVLEMG